MKPLIPAAVAASLLLAGCGKQELAMPADPVERGATCAAVAAAAMRKGSTNMGSLDLAQQGRLLHYALIEGAATPEFSQDTASAVTKRMGELGETITETKWEPLVPACDAAYPATTKTSGITLPADPLDARLGCYALASFVTGAMQQADPAQQEAISGYMAYRRDEDAPVGKLLKARGLDADASDAARKKALSAVVKLGSPIAVIDVCVAKYGHKAA